MPIVERFAPPAYLSDFDSIPGQREQWHKAVSYWFDSSIELNASEVHPGPFQFYNPARFNPGGIVVEQAVTWNAFPKELLRLFGREKALKEADKLWTLDRYFSVLGGVEMDRREYLTLVKQRFRPQTEYCEWRVDRDGKTGPIRRVTFTSEPPEFWFALFGNRLPFDPPKYKFTGDRKAVRANYENFVGQKVPVNDLIASHDILMPQSGGQRLAIKNQYNIYNKWNTTDGIVHLCAPPNFLVGEIELGSDAAIVRKNRSGRLLVEPEALVCCAGFGGPNRNSDPTIGAAVNAAARLGAFVTLKDPVGLYMDHIDLSGWELSDGKGVASCVHIVRGTPGMIERLVIEVPRNRGLTVSDITIGGEPIKYGGQIAECVTVKLIGIATLPKQPVRNDPVRCSGRCVFKCGDRRAMLQLDTLGDRLGRGFVEAFSGQGLGEAFAAEKRRHVHHRARQPMLRRRMP